MKTCADKVSKYFTELTSVIDEGNRYEFPSKDIHKAIISKLILENKHLKNVFMMIKKLYEKQGVAQNLDPGLKKQMDNFRKIEEDL